MDASEDLFKGVRPSDLRFDNFHILADYIARAQRFADNATRIEASAEQLVQGAMKTTQEGVKQFQATLRQMQLEFMELQRHLSHVVTAAGIDIAKTVADAHEAGARYISFYGEMAKVSYDGLATRTDEINLATARLEQAAEKTEATRLLAHDEFEQMRGFKLELARFERESLARLSDARASLYQEVGLWQRICYVPFPPVLVVLETKMPIRPSASRGAPSTPTATTTVSDRRVCSACRAALANKGRGK